MEALRRKLNVVFTFVVLLVTGVTAATTVVLVDVVLRGSTLGGVVLGVLTGILIGRFLLNPK